MIEEKIKKLIEARKNRREKWIEVLSALHEKLEPAFQEYHLIGPCGHCTGCHNKTYYEQAIKIGRFGFSDGGNCHRPMITFDGEQILFKYRENEWKILDGATPNFSEMKKELDSYNFEKEIEKLIEKAEKTTP